MESGLVFRVCLPDTSAAHLPGYCSHWFQSNPGGKHLSSKLYTQFPPLFSFFHSEAGTEIAFQNIEILQETNWPFSTLVRKTWAGRVGSKKTASRPGICPASRSSLTRRNALSKHHTIISDGRCAAINCFNAFCVSGLFALKKHDRGTAFFSIPCFELSVISWHCIPRIKCGNKAFV